MIQLVFTPFSVARGNLDHFKTKGQGHDLFGQSAYSYANVVKKKWKKAPKILVWKCTTPCGPVLIFHPCSIFSENLIHLSR